MIKKSYKIEWKESGKGYGWEKDTVPQKGSGMFKLSGKTQENVLNCKGFHLALEGEKQK